MGSHNTNTYTKRNGYDNKQFILEKERRKVIDEAYKPKKDFTTHYKATFQSQAGLVGSPVATKNINQKVSVTANT